MEAKLQALQKEIEESRSKTQNTSSEKYEILWNLEEIISQSPKETVASLQGKFFNLLIKEVLVQNPSAPLERVVSDSIIALCKATGGKYSTTVIKTLMVLVQQKTTLNTKLTAIECIGRICNKIGMEIGGIAMEIITLFSKQFKSNQLEKKVVSLTATSRLIEGLMKSGSHIHAFILKTFSKVIVDKEVSVRAAATSCLKSISQYISQQNIEENLKLAIKLIEDPSLSVRTLASQTIAYTLIAGYEISNIQNVSKKKMPDRPQANQPPSPFKDWNISTSLEFLSTNFLRGGTNRKEMRAGLTQSFVLYLQQIPTKDVRVNMALIIQKILELLVNSSMKNYTSMSELLQAHACVSHILNAGLRGHLGEEGQQKMALVLAQVLVKPGYNEYILILALRQLSYLFLDLGQGVASLWDVVNEPLSKLLSHPSYSVRGVCAITARALATALPDRHAILLRSCLNVTTLEYAEITTCKPDDIKLHLAPLQGSSYSVAGLISIIPHSKFGVPSTVTKFSLKTAKTLLILDASCKNDATLVTRFEAGWSILSALTTLGPTFVERKLIDILELWESSFKIRSQVPTTEKGVVVYCRVRTSALEALCNFIKHNESLLAVDVTDRISVWLEQTLVMMNKFPKIQFHGSTNDIINVLKATLVKTYSSLPVPSYSTNHIQLLSWISSELPRNSTNSVFRSILQEKDSILGPWPQDQDLQDGKLMQSPTVVVHDHSVVWSSDPEKELTNPIPTSKRVADEIIELLPNLFLVQSAEHQNTVVSHLIRCITESPPDIKSSVQMNVFCVLLRTVQLLSQKKKVLHEKILKTLLTFFQSYIVDPDPAIRRASGESIGYLAIVNNDLSEKLINSIISNLKNAKESLTKAGNTFALGCILRTLGAVRSGRYLPSIVSILHVLSKDPSPIVHIWSLHALWIVIETTSLSFSPFANPTISLCFSLLLSKSCTSNAIYQCIGRVVNSCISCIGPELQSNTPVFHLCTAIIRELRSNSTSPVQLESIHFMQMLALFAPQTVSFENFVPVLCSHLNSPHHSLRKASVICLRQLIQINPIAVSAIGDGLEEQLLMMIDQERDSDLRNDLKLLITSMIEYLGASNVSKYLNIFISTVSATNIKKIVKQEAFSPPPPTNEDEIEENAVGDDSGQLTQVEVEDEVVFVPRWRTRVLSMKSIGKLVSVIGNIKDVPEHFDLIRARLTPQPQNYLVYHLDELVTVSFNSATSTISALRPVGVSVLKEVVELFANTEDPEFEGHKLLEQCSAQVTAALRPAFAPDSPPNLTAAACEVVVSFICKTITGETSALRKVMALLTNSIAQIRDLHYPSYSEKASTIVQLSILSALARLHVSTLRGEVDKSLFDLIKPFLSELRGLWIGILRDYVILSTQPPAIQKAYKGNFYNFSSVTFVLDHYKAVWPEILHATVTLIDTEYWEKFERRDSMKSVSDKQLAFDDFIVCFGLCLICLSESNSNREITTAIQSLSYLFCKRYITTDSLPIQMVQEMFSAICIQLRISQYPIQKEIGKLLHQITLNLSVEYITSESDNSCDIVFHSLVESIIFPIHLETFHPDLVNQTMETICELQKFFQLKNLAIYRPFLAHLCCYSLSKTTNEVVSTTTIRALVSLVNNSEENLLFSSLNTIFDKLESSKMSPLFMMLAAISLISLSGETAFPSSIQAKISSNLHSLVCGQNAVEREKIVNTLSAWLQGALDTNSVYYKSASAFLKEITLSVIYFLRMPLQFAEENTILSSIKILIMIHTIVPADKKITLAILIIQCLVGLLQPDKSAKVTDYSLQVIQTMAAVDAQTFKGVADSLPPEYRQLLESAVRAQQEKAQVKVVTTRRRPKKIESLDFDKYADSDE